ncbi:hypothetical protein U1Q18_019583 [Sarracenia purpurea var. burkii]
MERVEAALHSREWRPGAGPQRLRCSAEGTAQMSGGEQTLAEATRRGARRGDGRSGSRSGRRGSGVARGTDAP